MNNSNIEVKILDLWEEYNYELKGYQCYALVEIGGKIRLWESFNKEGLHLC